MADRIFRIQGLTGEVHDARWRLWKQRECVGIRLQPAVGHDVRDLAASIYCTLLRLHEVTDHVEVRSRVDVQDRADSSVEGSVCEVTPVARHLIKVPSSYEVVRRLESEFARVREEGREQLQVTVSTVRTTALEDASDLIALLLLRDVSDLIERAETVYTRWLPKAVAVLRPALPVDAHLLVRDDPRFTALLGQWRDLRELLASTPPSHWDRAQGVLDEVDAIRDGLQNATIEVEAASVLSSALGEGTAKTWAVPLGHRFGLDGRKVHTLHSVGLELGVSRERVRQVQSKIALPERPVWAPSMDAALTLIDHTAPCTIEELGEALQAAGLSALPIWHANALRAAASVTGRDLDLDEVDGFVCRSGQVHHVKAVMPAARAASNLSGVATAQDVLDRLEDQAMQLDRSVVRTLLRNSTEVHWLTGQSFWTDHPPGRNRLVNTSLRILAVMEPQTLEDMHEGVARNYRWRSATGTGRLLELRVPGLCELSAFYDSHPAFEFTADRRLVANQPVDIESIGAEKLAMVGVLRSQPFGVMDRNSLLNACREAGMKAATATVFTTYAECIKNFGPNVWGLRGAVVPEEVIHATQRHARTASKTHDRRNVDGTTESGRPWMARKVTPSFLNSGVIPFDWGKNQLTDSKLIAIDMLDGEPVGSLRFVNNFNYGYIPFLGKHSLSVGDVIRVLADPESDRCHIEFGGDELLSQPFDV